MANRASQGVRCNAIRKYEDGSGESLHKISMSSKGTADIVPIKTIAERVGPFVAIFSDLSGIFSVVCCCLNVFVGLSLQEVKMSHHQHHEKLHHKMARHAKKPHGVLIIGVVLFVLAWMIWNVWYAELVAM